MERVALLIGFGYRGTDELKGCLFDLYRMHRLCKRWGFREIRVATDRTSELGAADALSSLVDGHVQLDSLSFLRDARAELVPDRAALERFLRGSGRDFTFLYVSGHGLANRGLLCPDGRTLEPQEIRTLANSRHSVEVWDVCFARTFVRLPYALSDQSYVRTAERHVRGDVLAFASGRQLGDDAAVAAEDGSLASRALCRLLAEDRRLREYDKAYRKLFSSHGYEQRHALYIYASRPDAYSVPAWLYGKTYAELRYDPLPHWRVYRAE